MIRDDPVDLAEVRAIQQDMAALHERFRLRAVSAGQGPRAGFRPLVAIRDRQTLVMCDQLATVDLHRLIEPVGLLSIEERRRVDEALALVLDL